MNKILNKFSHGCRVFVLSPDCLGIIFLRFVGFNAGGRTSAILRDLAITLYFKAVCFHVIWKHTATGSKTDTKLEYTHYQWDSSCIVVWTQV